MTTHWAKFISMDDFDLRSIGNEREITGVLYGDVLIMLPGEDFKKIAILSPTLDQWTKIIRQSDLKEVEVMDRDKKIVLRKSSRQIDQRVSWEVFRRDNFICRYCGEDKQPLTVDHVVTWEQGGPTIPMNLISSCKKCNNKRGNMDFEDWLGTPFYLANIPSLPVNVIADNSRVLLDIPYIKEHYLQPRKSR